MRQWLLVRGRTSSKSRLDEKKTNTKHIRDGVAFVPAPFLRFAGWALEGASSHRNRSSATWAAGVLAVEHSDAPYALSRDMSTEPVWLGWLVASAQVHGKLQQIARVQFCCAPLAPWSTNRPVILPRFTEASKGNYKNRSARERDLALFSYSIKATS